MMFGASHQGGLGSVPQGAILGALTVLRKFGAYGLELLPG